MDAPDASPPSASPQRLDFIAWCEAKINPRLPAPVRDQVRAAIRAVKWDDAAQTPRKLALQDAYVRLQQQYRDAPAHDAAGAVPDLVDLETLRCWNSGLTHEAVTFLLARHGGWDAARCVDPDNTTVQSKRYRDVDQLQKRKDHKQEDRFAPLARLLTDNCMNRVKYEILTRRLGANKRVKGELEQLKQATGVDMARGLKQCMGSLMEEMQARLEGEVHALIAKVAAEETPGHAAHGTDDQDEARQTTSHAADDDESDEAENMESKSKRARQS